MDISKGTRRLAVLVIGAIGLIGGHAFLTAVGTPAALAFRTISTDPGSLMAWGSDPFASLGGVSGNFTALAAGGGTQTLALRADGTLYMNAGSDLTPIPLPAFGNLQFKAVGMGRQHGLAIRKADGGIETWGLNAARCLEPTPPAASCEAPAGDFLAATGGGQFSIALDTQGNIVLWGGHALTPATRALIIGVGAPAGIKFKAIAARLSYVLALSVDGHIYGWGLDNNAGFPSGVFTSWTPDNAGHYIAPYDPANPYKAIATGLGFMLGLHEDGQVAVWNPSGFVGAAPPNVIFTQVAAGSGAMNSPDNSFAVGIDQAGNLHGWGVAAPSAPGGCFSAVSAAALHLTAIRCQALTNAGPGRLSIGLKNSDDQGTRFDLRTDLYKNGMLVNSGITRCISGITRNPDEVSTSFDPLSSPVDFAPGDVLSFKVQTRIGTNGDNSKCPGHNNATGLRLYYDGIGRPSRIEAQIAPNPVGNLYLHASNLMDTIFPTAATAIFRDSLPVNFSGGNLWKDLGTWNMTVK